MTKTILLHTPRFDVVRRARRSSNRTVHFYYVSKPDAVVIVPYCNGRIVILETLRHLIDGRCFELPGGRIEKGESAGEAAARELKEECGLTADSWTLAATTFPLPSVTTEKVFIYFAKVKTTRRKPSPRNERHEGIVKVRTFSFHNSRIMAKRAKICCSLDAYALLLFLESRAEKRKGRSDD